MRVLAILSPLFLLLIFCFIFLIFNEKELILSDISNFYTAPNLNHLLGTDNLGRDLLARLSSGILISFFISILSSFLAIFLALFYVFLSRCFFYKFFMHFLGIFLAFPSLIFIMFFQSFFGGSMILMILLIAFMHFAYIAKVFDSELKRLENMDFYSTALSLKTNKFKAFFKELLPGLFWLIGVFFALNIVHAISTEAMLGFFSIGLDFGTPSLGNILNEASKGLFLGAWWMLVFPLFALLNLVLPLLFLSSYWQKKYGVKF